MNQITRHILAISHSHFHSSIRRFRTTRQIQVQTVTTETIKPLTPTPQHLRRHNLSLFDSIMPQEYMNTIVYFSRDPSKPRSYVSNTLKTSLAEILSIYYPLAGRVAHNNLYVDCHDQGAHYLETNVKGSLNDETISELDPSEISKFLSHDHKDMSAVGTLPLLVVQANFFECGGLVIGLLMSHVVADGVSLFTFLKNWASVARNVNEKGVHNFILPDFGAAKIFPSADLTGMTSIKEEERVSHRNVFYNDNKGLHNFIPSDVGAAKLFPFADITEVTPVKEEENVTRRFVFSDDTIFDLCKKYSVCGIQNQREELFERNRPSRVEALSAFIWKRYIASTQILQLHKTYRIVQAVNLRSRFDPPLLPSMFGSFAEMAIAIDESPDKDDHPNLVKTIRTSISNLSDSKNIELYKNEVQFNRMLKERCAWMTSENEVWILFTSVCRMYQFREADFGWGPPSAMHVYISKMCTSNIVVFMNANEGNGIEAWIYFNKEDMAKFEVDPEVLVHATRLAC